MATNEPVSAELLTAYIEILERQVGQMSIVVLTINDIKEKLIEINAHFNNGFKDDITDHIDQAKTSVISQIEKVASVAATLSVTNDKASIALAALNDKNTTMMINQLDRSMSSVQNSLKVYAVTNAVGWSALIVSIVLKVLGKI